MPTRVGTKRTALGTAQNQGPLIIRDAVSDVTNVTLPRPLAPISVIQTRGGPRAVGIPLPAFVGPLGASHTGINRPETMALHAPREPLQRALKLPAKPGALGSTGISFSAIFDDLLAERHNQREDRYVLRGKVRRYADRTLVPSVAHWNTQTGEAFELMGRMVPRDDKFLACGRRVRGGVAAVDLVLSGDSAGLTNLQSCGSGWVCPVCSAKIQAHRAGELGEVLAWCRACGHTLAMVTLTVQHSREQSLDAVWDAVSDGWHAVTGGVGAGSWGSENVEKFAERLDKWESAVMSARAGHGRMPRGGHAGIPPQRRIGDAERFGVLGWARAVEVTHGLNGWHVHVHAVLVLEGEKKRAKQNAHAVGSAMFDRWLKGLNKTGFAAKKWQHGLHVSVAERAEKNLMDYLTKDQNSTGDTREKIIAANGKKARKLALEVALGDAKSGKRGGKTPFQILDAIDPEAPGAEYAQWREWVRSSAGRLALTWSAGLRELAKLPPEALTDEEITEQRPDGDVVLSLPPGVAVQLVRDDSVLRLLEAAERGGPAAARAWLTARDLPFILPD